MNEPRTYEIRVGDVTLDRLVTAATADASADEGALENLARYAAGHPGRLELWFLDGPLAAPLAVMDAGEVRLLVDPDSLAADGCHCGPRIVVEYAAPVGRRGTLVAS